MIVWIAHAKVGHCKAPSVKQSPHLIGGGFVVSALPAHYSDCGRIVRISMRKLYECRLGKI